MVDYLLTLAEQFELLAAKIADLQDFYVHDGHAADRLETAQEAVKRGLDGIHRQIDTIRGAASSSTPL